LSQLIANRAGIISLLSSTEKRSGALSYTIFGLITEKNLKKYPLRGIFSRKHF
jgi:hypothetical protein